MSFYINSTAITFFSIASGFRYIWSAVCVETPQKKFKVTFRSMMCLECDVLSERE